jgi:hypothetical protein
MMAYKKLRTWMLTVASVSSFACDPDDPCDPGYYADHGVCVGILEMPEPKADGGSDDAGPNHGFANDDTDFGRACELDSDCGGKAPACGAPMLPLCTAVNCIQGEAQCPPAWTCLDISNWDERPYLEVLSICVKI